MDPSKANGPVAAAADGSAAVPAAVAGANKAAAATSSQQAAWRAKAAFALRCCQAALALLLLATAGHVAHFLGPFAGATSAPGMGIFTAIFGGAVALLYLLAPRFASNNAGLARALPGVVDVSLSGAAAIFSIAAGGLFAGLRLCLLAGVDYGYGSVFDYYGGGGGGGAAASRGERAVYLGRRTQGDRGVHWTAEVRALALTTHRRTKTHTKRPQAPAPPARSRPSPGFCSLWPSPPAPSSRASTCATAAASSSLAAPALPAPPPRPPPRTRCRRRRRRRSRRRRRRCEAGWASLEVRPVLTLCGDPL